MCICRICKEDLPQEVFVKSKVFKSGWDTICRGCSRAKVKEWRAAGKRNSAEESRRYSERYPDKVREKSKRYYDKHLRNPRVLKTKDELRVTKNVADSKRRARMRYPSWANPSSIRQLYKLAKQKTKETGVLWVVDHIIPLLGATVSGLHVENNLQVVPSDWNRKKWNLYDGTEQQYDPATDGW